MFLATLAPLSASAENEAEKKTNEVMQLVFTYVERNGFQPRTYESEIYQRHRMYTKRKGIIARYVPGMLRLERGVRNYFSEAEIQMRFRDPGEADFKVKAFHSTATYMEPQRMVDFGRFHFRIYAPKLLQESILNPLHPRNRSFYRYRTLYYGTAQGKQTAHISIKPRFTNEQLVKGDVDVDVKTGAVRHFSFTFRYGFRTISLNGRPGAEGEATLLPERIQVISRFRMWGNKVDESCDMTIKNRFLPMDSLKEDSGAPLAERLDLTRQCLLRIDTTCIITAPEHFDSLRPRPLTRHEKEIISSQDSLNALTPRRHRIIGPRTEDLLLSSHHFSLKNEGNISVKLPPIFTPSMVAWSQSKGLSLQTRIRLHAKLPKMDGACYFSPRIGYTFKQDQIYWQLPLQIDCIPALNGRFSITAGGGQHLYSNRQAEEVRKKLEQSTAYDSLVNILDSFGFHDYRDNYIKTDFCLSPTPGLVLTLGTRYHLRTLIEWTALAKATGMKHHLSSLAPRVEVQWTPRQYYYKQGKRRIPLYSKYPTFLWCYEHGFPLKDGHTGYAKMETDIRWRIPLYAMRSLFFRAGAGFYTRRSRDCFLEYDFFRFNYVPENHNDDMSGEFQLLNARWYNESRYYLHLTSTYESPMMLLSRIPGISRVVRTERIYLNLLSVRALGIYTEAGYGFSTHILDLGLFTGMAADRTFNFGFKVSLRLFED